ncbi:MAG: WYL domain-containing protein [Clostridia bacterium]|nr:WYL domain-containing protein [Clostridia bacterium]
MLFSELYGAYYNTVAAILREGLRGPLTERRISEIAAEHAFAESFLTITEALKDGSWPLLDENRMSAVRISPGMPLTVLQKRWLNAVSLDPRVRLFEAQLPYFPEVEPLFRPEDICVFDKYADGDDYEDENYVRHFRLVLDAVKNRYPLRFELTNRKGSVSVLTAQPEYIEYSEKDDKFRASVSGCRFGDTVNIGRIISCSRAKGLGSSKLSPYRKHTGTVVLDVTDERNALERVLLHFAHFAKEAEKTGEDSYRVTVEYDMSDETEMVIRILSFGPMVKAVSPDSFIDLIKDRLKRQKDLAKAEKPPEKVL